MTCIETKLWRDDKDLAFYMILQWILPKNELSSIEFQFFVTYKIKILKHLQNGRKF